MRNDYIFIKGAREHNLKNIDVKIPRNKLVVITGISGSGKSSLAFDTIYAEGQRRYIESLSAYARQFLGMLEKPNVDYIQGLSPAIAIEQRTSSRNPRSTVGTVTEIYDYLRLLFARIGKPFCPNCEKEIASQTTDQIVDAILTLPPGTEIQLLAPLVRGRKGEYSELFKKVQNQGFIRLRIDGEIYDDFSKIPKLERYKAHNIEIVVDRLIVRAEIRKRLADSLEICLKEGKNLCIVSQKSEGPGGDKKWIDRVFSTSFACVDCGFSYQEISPRLFSFNSPYGACPLCHGLGTKMEIDPERLINPELSVMEGAIEAWGEPRSSWFSSQLEAIARQWEFDLNTPWKELPKAAKNVLLYGTKDEIEIEHTRWNGTSFTYEDKFEGVIPHLERLYHSSESESTREWAAKFMSILPCPACQGARLKKEALSIRVRDRNIHEITNLTVKNCLDFFQKIDLTEKEKLIGGQVIKEIEKRLLFLSQVGLDYLTLDRRTETLGGGEEQRVRLATQIGSGLVGVVYILDEPSIGLHQRDNLRLLDSLKRLRDLGNTVLVVEHDKETILSADYVIDLGPGAGDAGGYVVATGKPEEIMKNQKSLTGAYLDSRKMIPIPKFRRRPKGEFLVVKGATENNLKDIDVRIPLGLFVCITGVSGSGKSTLIIDILYRGLAEIFYSSRERPGAHKEIIIENYKSEIKDSKGIKQAIDKVINIDQSPIGRTPRSNPATYTNAFTPIRELFSEKTDAKMRGYKPGRFSFNVRGGRCEACSGDGIIKIEMHFLPPVYVPCDVCKGKRYNRETLEIRYKGKNISDVLNMTVDEAEQFFQNIPTIARKLRLLKDVGLGYIKLGQPAPTLSGGEAQRIKLARELSKIATGKTIYLLDEPTTGLHFEDVKLLLGVLNRLVEKNNTVIVIEHNLEVIKCADYIIDLGPEGGDEGGRVVAAGPPEAVARVPNSYTGKFLKKILNI